MGHPAVFTFALLMCSAEVCFCAAGAVRTLAVKMTLVPKAAATGALCLDGSPPGYHLHRGYGAGVHNWLLQFEGGGWCNDLKSCAERANSRRGSTRLMNKMAIFSGILTNRAALNPDFHNWNRVKIRYCDGASFTGDAVYKNGSKTLYFRGARIWEALIRDLLPKGLGRAKNALLSGCSAGGLSAFLHCDNFTRQLPATTNVKCLSDAGFFLDGKDVSGRFTFRSIYNSLIKLQGAGPNLNKNCNPSPENPSQCFFPQYLLKDMKTPFFVLNTAYDVFQFKHILVPPSADKTRVWGECTLDPGACNAEQIETLQGFRQEMLAALKILEDSEAGGMFINSCFAHCQSESQETWLADDSPRINNKTISEVIGNWYFNRKPAKEIDCPYPCSKTCHNLIPALPTGRPTTN